MKLREDHNAPKPAPAPTPADKPAPSDVVRSLQGRKMTRDGKPALTVEQLNAKGAGQRSLTVSGVDREARTVDLAFSSEFADGARWFGIEVLDHSPGACKLERLQDHGALLFNHDDREQIGVVVSASIGADRVGRATVRFGKGPRASEIFEDVADGIRKHVSVGYRLLDAKLKETRADGLDVYLVTSWEPYEISIVPVPFDHSVGVGRSAEAPPVDAAPRAAENPPIVPNLNSERSTGTQNTMNIRNLRDPATGHFVRAEVNEAGEIVKVLEVLERAGEAAAQAGTRALDAERARGRDILAMGETYGCRDLALKAVADGVSVADFTRTALDHVNTRGTKPGAKTTAGPTDANAPKTAEIGMSDRDVRRYSIFNAVRALLNPTDARAQEAAAFERECSRAAETQTGKASRGILIPQDVLGRAFNAGGMANTPVGATTGANLIDTQYMAGSFIEMLRNRTVGLRLARIMGGLVGNVEIPKQIGGATAGWIGEGQNAPEGTPVIGQLGLSPKTIAVYTDLSRKLMQQSTPDAEGIVRQDLVAAMGLGIDKAMFYGSGTANQPLGIANMSGLNAVNFTTASKPTYAELVQMETEIATDNADVSSMAYVLNTTVRGYAKTTPKFAGGTDQGVLWESGGTLNGYRAEVTNQVAATDVFFGNWNDFIVGMWGGLDMTVDPYSLSLSGGLRIVVFQDVDFAIRRAESFTIGKKSV